MKDNLFVIDRDGTINYDPGFFGIDPKWRNQLTIYSGVVEGLKLLKNRGKVVVASNQAGVARGYLDLERVTEVNRAIAEILNSRGVYLDGWYSCPFVDKDYAAKHKIPLPSQWVNETDLRKPGIGMIKLACEDLRLKLEETQIYVIGDKEADVRTGLNANGKSVLVTQSEEGRKAEEAVEGLVLKYPDRVFKSPDVLAAARIVLDDIARRR